MIIEPFLLSVSLIYERCKRTVLLSTISISFSYVGIGINPSFKSYSYILNSNPELETTYGEPSWEEVEIGLCNLE